MPHHLMCRCDAALEGSGSAYAVESLGACVHGTYLARQHLTSTVKRWMNGFRPICSKQHRNALTRLRTRRASMRMLSSSCTGLARHENFHYPMLKCRVSKAMHAILRDSVLIASHLQANLTSATLHTMLIPSLEPHQSCHRNGCEWESASYLSEATGEIRACDVS